MIKQAGRLRAKLLVGLATAGLVVAGIPAALAGTLTPDVVNFGNQPVGTISAPQTLTYTNTSVGTQTITSISVTGDFIVSGGTCAVGTMLNDVAPGNTCTVEVRFAPTATGTRNGTLTIVDTAQTETAVLTGIGVAADGDDDEPAPAPPAPAGGNACSADSDSGASSASCSSSGGAQGGEAEANGAPGGDAAPGGPGGGPPTCTADPTSILGCANQGGILSSPGSSNGAPGGNGGNGGTANAGDGTSNAESESHASVRSSNHNGGDDDDDGHHHEDSKKKKKKAKKSKKFKKKHH
jgi:hypothetical protein